VDCVEVQVVPLPAAYRSVMPLIALLLLNLVVTALFAASGYALTRLHRPKLAAVLAVAFLALLVVGNTQMKHWIHPCFSDSCGDQSPAPVTHRPL
jgi:hypothetical protein